MQLDERRWTPLQKNVTATAGRDYTLEFVPAGQSASNWSELFTSQFFAFNQHEKLPAQPVSIKPVGTADFKAAFLKALGNGISPGATSLNKPSKTRHHTFPPGTTISTREINQTVDSTLFYWQANTPDGQVETAELILARQGVRGLRVLHYASKSLLTAAQLQKWQALLQATAQSEEKERIY